MQNNTTKIEPAELKRPVIQVLNDTVANQIAAGEVVERPSSVVKELVENSIDALATEITVVLAQGGKSEIEVIDNGLGLSKDEALLAIKRFATSKLQTPEDLIAIKSLGFRGEALPSIASVSKFTLASSARNFSSGNGVYLEVHGGSNVDVSEKAHPPGTRITISDLFYNVPARRKFLRSERSEENWVKSLLVDFALAYPHVRFQLISEGREVAVYPPANSFIERAKILKVAGPNPLELHFQREAPNGILSISGLLSQPSVTQVGGSKLRLIVNGRVLKDKLLLRAVREGYGAMLKGGKYPIGVIQLNIPPQHVDVNVHPQKSEVRFRHPDLVFSSIVTAIRKVIDGQQVTMSQVESSSSSYEPSHSSFLFSHAKQIPQPVVSFFSDTKPNSAQHELKPFELPQAQSIRYVGQIFKCYLLFEATDTFLLVDMHAAHERVRFFEIKRDRLSGKVPTQRLLVPEVIEVSHEILDEYEGFSRALENVGFEVEKFGDTSVLVREVPAILSKVSAKEIFEELAVGDWWQGPEDQVEKSLDEVVSRLACHSSIRSGRELEKEEAFALLEKLETVETSGLCPHGRPVMHRMSIDTVRKLFARL